MKADNFPMTRHREAEKGEAGKESGFTLPELMTAIALFSLLVVIMSTVLIVGMRNINTITTRTNIGGSQQNAMEWASRLVRYTANPNVDDEAIIVAGPYEYEAYSYSGTGNSDQPFRIRIWLDEENGVMASVVTAVLDEDNNLDYTGNPVDRMLVPISQVDMSRPIFTYFSADGTELVPSDQGTCTAGDGKTDTCYGDLTLEQKIQVKAVGIYFDNSGEFTEVEQRVGLVNLE